MCKELGWTPFQIERLENKIEQLTAERDLSRRCHKQAEASITRAWDRVIKLEVELEKEEEYGAYQASRAHRLEQRVAKLEAVRKATVMYLNDSSIYKMRKLEEALADD